MYVSLSVCVLCCVFARADVCSLASPALYIISSPIEAEDGGGGKLLSERLHKYSGYRRGGGGWGVGAQVKSLSTLTYTNTHFSPVQTLKSVFFLSQRSHYLLALAVTV